MYSFANVKKKNKKITPVKTNLSLRSNSPVQLTSGAANITYYIEITTGSNTRQSYSGIDRYIEHVTTRYGGTVRYRRTDYTNNSYHVNFSSGEGSDHYAVGQIEGFLQAGATAYENELNSSDDSSTYSVVVRRYTTG